MTVKEMREFVKDLHEDCVLELALGGTNMHQELDSCLLRAVLVAPFVVKGVDEP